MKNVPLEKINQHKQTAAELCVLCFSLSQLYFISKLLFLMLRVIFKIFIMGQRVNEFLHRFHDLKCHLPLELSAPIQPPVEYIL